jgi:cell division septum initiation protein DivIVA
MEMMKKLEKYAMKVLNEADHYADEYTHCSHQGCKDLYYTLATSHHEMYNKIRTQIASEVNRLMREHPEMHADVIVEFLRDTEDDLVDRIKKKLGR